MNKNKIICVYCKKPAELISGNNTAVYCPSCGFAMELETYKELFDRLIYQFPKESDEG